MTGCFKSMKKRAKCSAPECGGVAVSLLSLFDEHHDGSIGVVCNMFLCTKHRDQMLDMMEAFGGEMEDE